MSKQNLQESIWKAIAKVFFNSDINKITKAVKEDPNVKDAAKRVDKAVKDLQDSIDDWLEQYHG